jgi:ADP-ribose pyrophosphatase YjhB (NUDIX family)
MSLNRDFVIRIYGIIINDKNEVLLSDEFQLGIKMTKFPGGGLEYGEGTIEGLKREFREECNGQEIKNIRHFYTTDFFQKALFNENKQLLSIYYVAELSGTIKFKISEGSFDFQEYKNGNQSFRWVEIKRLNEDEITFPIDKFVAVKLKKQFL